MRVKQNDKKNTSKYSENTSHKAYKIVFEKGVRLTQSVKATLKNNLGCQFSHIHNAYVFPITNKSLVSSLFEERKINASYQEVIDFLANKSKPLREIENRLLKQEEDAYEEGLRLLAEVQKYNKNLYLSDFLSPPSVENKSDSQIALENDFHIRYVALLEKKEEIENLRNSRRLHEEEGQDGYDILEYLSKNENGDAELFAKLFKDKYVFDPTEGKAGAFYIWNENSWQIDKDKQRYIDFDGVAIAYANSMAKITFEESIKEHLEKRIYQLRTHRRRCCVLETVSAYLSFKKSWDCIPKLLPCENGVFDLTTGEFYTAEPSLYIRKVCPVKYNPKAESPLFNQFLDDITLNNNELKSFLGRVLGSALLGTSKEEKVFIFYGKDGRNGKGTLMQTLEKVLGPLAKTFPAEMLLLQRNPPSSSTPRPEKANLQGVRFAIFSEIDEKRQIDASELKNLSGGDTITCRKLFSNHDIQIRPSHTMFIQTNFKPKASVKDGALWKRNVLVPFNAEFVSEPKEAHHRKIDEGFKEKLLAEGEGILNWLIQGCFEYQRIGLSTPQIVKDETANYRKENDGIQLFIEEMCIQSSEFSAPKSKMTAAIQKYCKENNYEIPNRNEISTTLKQRYKEGHNRNGDFWCGIKIYDEKELQED